MRDVRMSIGLLFLSNKYGYYLSVVMAIFLLPVFIWVCMFVSPSDLLTSILVTVLVELSLIGSAVYLRRQWKMGKESAFYLGRREEEEYTINEMLGEDTGRMNKKT